MLMFLTSLFMLICSLNLCSAQAIESYDSGAGKVYTYQGERINSLEMKDLIREVPVAFSVLKKARANSFTAKLFAFSGGFCIGFPIARGYKEGSEINYDIMKIGGALLAIALPISMAASRKRQKAVEIYNASVAAAARRNFSPRLSFVSNREGAGIALDF